MPRENYTNVGPSQERDELLEKICKHLVLDPGEHSARLRAIDFALRMTVQQIESPPATAEALQYLNGNMRAGEIEDEKTRQWAYLREIEARSG